MSTQPLWNALVEIDYRLSDTDGSIDTLLSVSKDRGVIRYDKLFPDRAVRAENHGHYKFVKPGFIVLNKMSAATGAVGVATESGVVSPDYAVFIPRDGNYSKFIGYVLGSNDFCKNKVAPILRGIGVGDTASVRTPLVGMREYLSLRIPFPSMEKQQNIADYLDRETAEIDAAVTDLDKYVELLKKRKFSILVQAFPNPSDTRCANGSRFAGWESRPLWSMFAREKILGFVDEPMVSVFRDRGVVYKDEHENLNRTAEDKSIYQLIQPGWLVVNRMKAWQGSVGVSKIRGITSGHYICFRPIHGQDHQFINYLLRSPGYISWYWKHSRGVRPGQAEIDNQWLNGMPILFPSVEAQRKIIVHLDRETAEIDALISESQKLRDLLLKRRSVLITDVVTGRKQV